MISAGHRPEVITVKDSPDSVAFIGCQTEVVFHVTARFNEIDVDHLSGDRLDRIPEFFASVSAIIQIAIVIGGGIL